LFSDQFRRGESDKDKLAGVTGSKIVSTLSDVAWKAFQSVNRRLPEGEAIRPNWAPGALLKSYERTAPPLGFPRETDSLCPRCVKEVRDAVISGDRCEPRQQPLLFLEAWIVPDETVPAGGAVEIAAALPVGRHEVLSHCPAAGNRISIRQPPE